MQCQNYAALQDIGLQNKRHLMESEMAEQQTTISDASRAVLAYLQANENVNFSSLVAQISREKRLDDATVKAAVLRLRSEGIIEIASDWIVRPVSGMIAAA